MSLPALPSAQVLTPAAVAEYASVIVEWAESSDSVDEVRDAANKWAAITEYIRRTSTQGVAAAEGAMRRLEVRVGELLGPAPAPGRPNKETSVTTDISRDARSEFRKMAANADVVEEVIANSTDDEPPSRRKVLGEIDRRLPEPPAARQQNRRPLPDAADRAAWDLRKTIERLERIFADDRYAANKTQVAALTRGHLTYTVEACQGLLDLLPNT